MFRASYSEERQASHEMECLEPMYVIVPNLEAPMSIDHASYFEPQSVRISSSPQAESSYELLKRPPGLLAPQLCADVAVAPAAEQHPWLPGTADAAQIRSRISVSGMDEHKASAPAPKNVQAIQHSERQDVVHPFSKPLVPESLGQEVAELATLQMKGDSKKWWTSSRVPLTCPLSFFPICLLPYPPFKMRSQASKSFAYKLVDGKYMAMWIISTGKLTLCGRHLQPADIKALDEYISQCKLGCKFRPGRVLELEKEAIAAHLSQQERLEAANELTRLRTCAKTELVKLQQIQGNRLAQLHQQLKRRVASDEHTNVNGNQLSANRLRASSSSTAVTEASTTSFRRSESTASTRSGSTHSSSSLSPGTPPR